MEKVLEFLKSRSPKLCVMSTVSQNNKPESALLGYAVLDDLSILINTNKITRKWKNLENNNKVSLVFGFGFTELNVQYEGTAQRFEDGEDLEKYDELFFSQNEDARKFKAEGTRIIKITPTWIRYTDTTVHPPQTEESSFPTT